MPDTTYDLVVYQAILSGPSAVNTGVRHVHAGKEIYYREALTEPRHGIQIQLEPRRYYLWTVRVRRGEYHGSWAKWRWWRPVPIQDFDVEFFNFRTP